MNRENGCWNCRFFEEDWSCGSTDCKQCDNMTEDEYEKYYGNDEPNCPFWKEHEDIC